MPLPITSKNLRESYRESLFLERLAATVFPDAGALQVSGCFSKLLFYDPKCPDFCVRLSDYFMSGDPDWEEGGRENAVLILQFVLHGDLHYKLEDAGGRAIPEGEFNLFTIPSLREICWFDAANRSTTTLDIYFSPVYLEKLITGYPELSRLLARRRLGFTGQLGSCHGVVTADMVRDLLAIVNCNYTGELRRIYMQSKVAELLLTALDRLTTDLRVKDNSFSLKRYDVKKLYESREYLLMNMENPPTLKELAQKMGINDFKLKKGYKQLFGATIFKDFHRVRMEKSMEELVQSKKTIMQIALLYGYQDVSNFSNAFKRHFGSPPSHFQKQRADRRK